MATLTKEIYRDTSVIKKETKNFTSFWKIDAKEMMEFHEIIKKIISGEMNFENLNSFEDLQFVPDKERLDLVFLLNSLSFKPYKDYFYSPYNKDVKLKDLIKCFCTEYYYGYS